jgi:hypothetical protein
MMKRLTGSNGAGVTGIGPWEAASVRVAAPAPRERTVAGNAAAAAPAKDGQSAPEVPLFYPFFFTMLLPALLAGGVLLLLTHDSVAPVRVVLPCLVASLAAAAGARFHARALSRILDKLSSDADRMTARLGGELPTRGRSALGGLARALKAAERAAIEAVERTRSSLEAEMQNSLDLQRRYALMQLLRNLGSISGDGASLEQALAAALPEIGDYLDWPLGRVVLLAQSASGDAAARVHWYAPDLARFAAFTQACAQSPGQSAGLGVTGRAAEGSLPHWVTDLDHREDWPARAAARSCGLRTGFVIPIVAVPGVTVLVEFFSDHRIEAGAEMIELVEAISAELWRTASRFHPESPAGDERPPRLPASPLN